MPHGPKSLCTCPRFSTLRSRHWDWSQSLMKPWGSLAKLSMNSRWVFSWLIVSIVSWIWKEEGKEAHDISTLGKCKVKWPAVYDFSLCQSQPRNRMQPPNGPAAQAPTCSGAWRCVSVHRPWVKFSSQSAPCPLWMTLHGKFWIHSTNGSGNSQVEKEWYTGLSL